MTALLRPVVAVLTWPVRRFGDVRRTYEVSLAPSDARAVVRGAIGTDPMNLPVMEGIAASRRTEVVGSVEDDGRLQVYIGSKGASGLGLVGRVSAFGSGSRIEARVGWVSLHRWLEPVFTALAIGAPGAMIHAAVMEADGLIIGLSLGLAVIVTGGRFLGLSEQARLAREHELPAVVERLDRVLAPHRREPLQVG